MAITIFLLGRPGSGKSTAARHIDVQARAHIWSTIHINDYQFLRLMYENDIHHHQFHPAARGGFDVIDFSVLDLALLRVQEEAFRHYLTERQLLLIEFARGDYPQAFKQFEPAFLRDAHFLFFEVSLDTCIQRVYQRTWQPTFRDDHFISEEMIRSYYSTENLPALTYTLLANYHVDHSHLHLIDNCSSRQQFYEHLDDFCTSLFDHINDDDSNEGYAQKAFFAGKVR